MKIKVLATSLLLLTGIFFSGTVKAQAKVDNSFGMVFIEDDLEYPSISGKFVMGPSGNIMITATFQLDERSGLIPEKGVNTIAVRYVLAGDQEEYKMLYIVNIPPSGRFTINYHLNGAGDYFPNGWGIYWKLF